MAATGARAAGTQRTDTNTDKRTPAQWYCVLFGGTLLLVGLIGFLANASFMVGDELEGDPLLGLFDVNGWHNIIHLASGAFLLALAKKRASARFAALSFAAVYGLVLAIGLIDGSDVLGIIPINSADNMLHLAITAAALVTGLMSSGDDAAIDRHAGADRAEGGESQRRSTRQPAVPAGSGSVSRATGRGPVPPTRT